MNENRMVKPLQRLRSRSNIFLDHIRSAEVTKENYTVASRLSGAIEGEAT
jgi:hypothetical protein